MNRDPAIGRSFRSPGSLASSDGEPVQRRLGLAAVVAVCRLGERADRLEAWSVDRVIGAWAGRGSGGDAGRAEDLDSVLGGGGDHQFGSGRLQGRRREGEGCCGLGEGAHEAFEAGGLGDKEEAGLV